MNDPNTTVHQVFRQAEDFFKAGNLPGTEALCRQILKIQPDHSDALNLMGLIAHNVGQNAAAFQLLQRAVRTKPSIARYRNNLGMVLSSNGALDQAIDALRSAIHLEPDHADAHFNLGNVFYAQGNFAQAASEFEHALRCLPQIPGAANNLGNALIAQGKIDQAIVAFQLAITLKHDFSEAFVNLGRALKDQGQTDRAVSALQNAVQFNPNLQQAYIELANVQLSSGNADQALFVYQQALRLNPHSPELHAGMGDVQLNHSRFEQAIASYRTAIQLNPADVRVHINLGSALRMRRKHDEAITVLTQAIQLKPDSAEAWHNLGNVLREQTKLDEAAAAFERALSINPNIPQTYNSIGEVKKEQGQIKEAVEGFREAIVRNPAYVQAHSNLLYGLYFHPDYDSRAIYEEHVRWRNVHAASLKPSPLLHANDRSPGRRLRIGYVSPDFRDHVVGRNLLPLLQNHDHEQFEIFCYSNAIFPDLMTNQMRRCSDQWRETLSMTDAQLADLIRKDQIDILVDLSLHMAHNRLLVFARKPAPVQVTFAGYPGTTGLGTIDYRLTDPYLDPHGMDESVYSERSIRLPDSFWCFDPLTGDHEISPVPAMPNGFVTFGCLNNFCKVNEFVLQQWAQVLNKVHKSQMMILADPGSHRETVLKSFEQAGIERERIQFVSKRPRDQYLELFHQIDIALDTLPYNGHTTSLDGFWMGVPLVTCVGNTVVGRAGLSQLSNLSLTELIAANENEFVRIAIELAGDLPRLAALRSTLRSRMQNSPLMDAKRFTQGIESAYREMWRRWVQG